MKKDNSTQNSLIIAILVLVFFVVLFFSVCTLAVGFNILLSKLPTKTAIPIPTQTPIYIPRTLEEVKANCSRGECLQACIAHADGEIQQRYFYVPAQFDEDVELVYYGISDEDELTKPRKFNVSADFMSFQEDVDAHKDIWNYFRTLIPHDQRSNLATLGIYAGAASGGRFDTTATENWITEISIFALEDIYYLSDVVVHEHGHYLTLNETQNIKWPEPCHQEPLYGCQKPDSYINLFYLEFWEDIYPEWEKVDKYNPGWGETDTYRAYYDEQFGLFYDKHKDRFLNDYAATDPIEDIAESWAAFVLQPTPQGDSIPEQKIRFFNQFPELVELRYQIIKGICTYEKAQ